MDLSLASKTKLRRKCHEQTWNILSTSGGLGKNLYDPYAKERFVKIFIDTQRKSNLNSGQSKDGRLFALTGLHS